VLRQLVKYWRSLGIRLLPYLDDFLFMAPSFVEPSELAARVLRDFQSAGFVVNMDKSVLHPSQSTTHLGMIVDSVSGQFEVPAHRWDKLQAAIRSITSATRHRVPVRQLAGCVGQIISMRVALGPVVHLYTRYLYEVINQALGWSGWVTVSQTALEELSFWSSMTRTSFRGPIWPPSRAVSIHMATDASEGAWGGVLLSVSNQQMPRQTRAHEFFTPEEQRQSSTMRELLGILGSLQSFLPLCSGAEVYVQTDSQNVVFVQQRGSRRVWLNAVAKKLFLVLLRAPDCAPH
jgi:hypothetical protein